MQRKLIELGNQCMVVSLPIQWVRKYGLTKGATLNLTEQDQTLIVTPQESIHKSTEIILSIPEVRESHLRTVIVNAYRAGYDKIRVTYHGKQAHLTECVKNSLLGFEVFSIKKHEYILESISTPTKDQFDQLLSKSIFTIGQLLDHLDSEELLEEVHRVSRLDNYLKRCLSKKMMTAPAEGFLWQFISNLTQIARQCLHLYEHLQGKPLPVFYQPQVKALQQMFEKLKESYLARDTRELMQLHLQEQSLVYEQRKKLLTSKDPILGHYFLSIARLIYLANSPLTGYLYVRQVQEPAIS